MNAQTNVTSLEKHSVLPESWIERLFARFSAMYGRKFADLWADCNLRDVKATWAEDLAGFTGEEIKRGVDACKTRTFPPTLPEFIQLCRPAVDYESLYVSAAMAVSSGIWNNKLEYWATQSVGAFEVRNEPYAKMKSRWNKAIEELKADGELPDIPERKEALPAPGRTSISKEEAKKRAAELGVAIGRANPKAWAHKIIKNPENYPAISLKMAKEAIGAAA